MDVESDIDDNTIPYHQYQLDSEVQDVPTEVSSAPPGEISMITILDDLRTQLDGHLKCWSRMAKMKGKPGHVRPESGFYEKLNAMMFVPSKELSREKLKDQLQGKDDTIRNLQTQINITRMLNVGSTVGSFDKADLRRTESISVKIALISVSIQRDSYQPLSNPKYLLQDVIPPVSKTLQKTHTRNTSATTQEQPNNPVNLSTEPTATDLANLCQRATLGNHVHLASKSVNTSSEKPNHIIRELNVVDHNQLLISFFEVSWRPTGQVVGSVTLSGNPLDDNFALYDTVL
ncbi:hypothetical protein Tco_0533642 [Tanacetum coccineum]